MGFSLLFNASKTYVWLCTFTLIWKYVYWLVINWGYISDRRCIQICDYVGADLYYLYDVYNNEVLIHVLMTTYDNIQQIFD